MKTCAGCGGPLNRGGRASNATRCLICLTAQTMATMPTPPAVARARVEAAIKRALRGEVRPQNRTP